VELAEADGVEELEDAIVDDLEEVVELTAPDDEEEADIAVVDVIRLELLEADTEGDELAETGVESTA
jgi:hypothetical protein